MSSQTPLAARPDQMTDPMISCGKKVDFIPPPVDTYFQELGIMTFYQDDPGLYLYLYIYIKK